jgi:hypothetical protein
MALSRNHFCHENEIMLPLFIVADLHVAINNIKVLSLAVEMQQ